MTRFLLLILALLLAPPVAAQTIWATPGGSNCSGSFALTNSNLTATATTASWVSCRTTTSHATGKWYFYITAANAQTQFLSGLENSSASITNFPGSTTSTGAGCQGDSATPLWFAGGGDTACGTGLTGSAKWQVAVDVGAGKVWGRVKASSTQWDKSATPNPSTGTGGATFTISGALFIACGAHATNVACTLDTTTVDADSTLSGFTVWDGSAVPSSSLIVPPIGPTGGY